MTDEKYLQPFTFGGFTPVWIMACFSLKEFKPHLNEYFLTSTILRNLTSHQKKISSTALSGNSTVDMMN